MVGKRHSGLRASDRGGREGFRDPSPEQRLGEGGGWDPSVSGFVGVRGGAEVGTPLSAHSSGKGGAGRSSLGGWRERTRRTGHIALHQRVLRNPVNEKNQSLLISARGQYTLS